MAYNKTIWENLPSTNTPLNESNLNKIEGGIADLYDTIYYKDGDTFSPIVTFVANGYVTAGTKSIVITIPVDKSLKNIKTITVSRLYAQARGQNGYINSTDAYYDFSADSSYTIEATKSSDKAVRIMINKSTAYTNINNNTLVCLTLGGQTKLTFKE